MKSIYHWIPDAELGGCEMALLAFIQGSKGYKHIVICCIDGPASALWSAEGADVVFLPNWFGRVDIWSREWRNYVKFSGIRNIILWSPSRLPWMLGAMRRSGVENCLIHIGTNQSVSWLKSILYLVINFLRKPDFNVKLVCCSRSVLDMVSSDLYLKNFRAEVIYNGIRKLFFQYTIEQREECKIAGTVGRLDFLKGHHLMITALPAVIAKVPQFKLEIVGDGVEMGRLKNLAKALGVENSVVFHGRTSRVIDIEIQWDVFLFASNETEGMGIALAEALALGLPVVVSDTQVMREVVGASGVYFKNGDAESLSAAIIECVLNRRSSSEMKLRAQTYFHPDAFSEKYLKAIFDK